LTSVSWLDEPLRANSESPPQEGRSLSVTVPQPAPTVVEPKTADLSRVHITFSRQFLRKLDAARDALSHSHPGASEQDILEAGLDLLLERNAKRKGLVKSPRKAAPPTSPRPRSRYIPAHVRREVWKRDGGKQLHPVQGPEVLGAGRGVRALHHDGDRSRRVAVVAPRALLLLEQRLERVAGILLAHRPLAEERVELVLRRLRAAAAARGAVAELEEVAGVRGVLVDDLLGVGLAALVRRGLVVVPAVEAGVEVGVAGGAGGAPPDRAVDPQGSAAAVTGRGHAAVS
jgi:hypothetical protein